MSVWQFRVDLVPREAIVVRYGALPSRVTDADLDDTSWLLPHQPSIWQLDSLFPPASSWSEDVRVYGHEHGDNLTVCMDGDRVEWVSACFDMRGNYAHSARMVSDLAITLDCVFLVDEYIIIEPQVDHLLARMERSLAKEYTIAPEKALRSLADKHRQKESTSPATGQGPAAPGTTSRSELPKKAKQGDGEARSD